LLFNSTQDFPDRSADRIAKRAPFGSEFVAITAVAWQAGNDRHGFVGNTLRDVGIKPVPLARVSRSG